MNAEQIYQSQNRAIHKACHQLCMPYEGNKGVYLTMMRDLTGRDVCGLSELSLGERDQFIRQLNRGGAKVYAPNVGKRLIGWKKGSADKKGPMDRPLAVHPGKRPLIKKIGAMLADMNLPWSYADGIARQSYRRTVVEWCTLAELRKIVQMLAVYQKRKQKGARHGKHSA